MQESPKGLEWHDGDYIGICRWTIYLFIYLANMVFVPFFGMHFKTSIL